MTAIVPIQRLADFGVKPILFPDLIWMDARRDAIAAHPS
jgi:hypothetical protein